MRMREYHRRVRRRRRAGERGAALVEFAIALPMFIALLLLVFDAGLGYTAARSSSAAARTAARVGALAGDARDADFRILDALRSYYGDSAASGADAFIVYLSSPLNSNGVPPAACRTTSVPGVCNRYDASILDTLDISMFATTTVPLTGVEICTPGSPDAAWCPLNRRLNEGSFIGVYVSSTYDTTTGIEADVFNLEDRAVFAMYFPPEPVTLDDLLGG